MTLNNLLYIKVLEGVKYDVNKQILATGVNYAIRALWNHYRRMGVEFQGVIYAGCKIRPNLYEISRWSTMRPHLWLLRVRRKLYLLFLLGFHKIYDYKYTNGTTQYICGLISRLEGISCFGRESWCRCVSIWACHLGIMVFKFKWLL